MFFVNPEDIKHIPKYRTVTYGLNVINYRSQKADPNRICLTASGNLVIYPGELATCTANLKTSKIIWNSLLSTEDAKYMCIDIKKITFACPWIYIST